MTTTQKRDYALANVLTGISKDEFVLNSKRYDIDSESAEALYIGATEDADRFTESELTDEVVESSLRVFPIKKVKLPNIQFYIWHNFLTPTECEQVIEIVKKNKSPSTVYDPDNAPKTFRTSETCNLGRIRSPLLRRLDMRMARVVGVSARLGEPLQAQYYDVGGQYGPHYDAVELSQKHSTTAQDIARKLTFMVYLNDVEEGGETFFPQVNLGVKPKAGTAIIWTNLDDQGSRIQESIHQAMPVKRGYKAIITKWFRSKIP